MKKVKWAFMSDIHIALLLSQIHKYELFDMGLDNE
jgi:hypothetical protein